jgi:large subunit ribosomal protein L25
MEKVVLKATKRDVVGKQVKAMRREGQAAGGHLRQAHRTDQYLAGYAQRVAGFGEVDFLKHCDDRSGWHSNTRPWSARKQRDFIKNRLLHVDFLAVSLTEQIRATVALRFTGVSLAVKDFNAILVHNLEQLNVECLPTDLPEYIQVDVSRLTRPGEGLRVRDIAVADNIRVLEDEDTMVVVAAASKIEEALPEAEGVEEEVSGEEPEISVERGKKEDEDEEEK